MKKIDKRDERKQAAEVEAAKKRKERDERLAKENELVEFFAEFHTDWRCEQEFNKISEGPESIYPHKVRRRHFLARVIEKRHELNSIIIEPHEGRFGHNTYWKEDLIKIPIEEALYNQLKAEAGILGLKLEEYIRGIYYTFAYEYNQKAAQRENLNKELVYKNRTPYISGMVPVDIRQKLDDTYGDPERGNARFTSYFDVLMQLARDHFNL